MPDQLADILKNDLVVQNNLLQDLRSETLSFCQSPTGLRTGIIRLNAKRNKFSSNVDSLEKVPYCGLFLSYAYYKADNYSEALKWGTIAIDGFDQFHQVWNSSIAHWICALIYKKERNADEAELYFKAAKRLMVQEIEDHKRRSLYKRAKECETIYSRMEVDAQLLAEDAQIRARTLQLGDNEIGLFLYLLRLVHGDNATAERLIEFECGHDPDAGRAEQIRRAIEHWIQDNR